MADVRVTQQTTEVLGSVSSDLRVTQQYIEYLRAYNDGFIDSTLDLTDAPIVGNMVRSRSVLHGIFFFERIDAAGVPISREIIQSLTDDTVVYDADDGTYTIVHNGLGDLITQQLIGIRAQDNLFNVSDEIDYVFLKTNSRPETVTADSIVSDFTSLDQNVSGATGITAIITFGQIITQEVGRGITDDITITQSITEIRRSNVTVTSSLSLSDTTDFTKNENDRNILCTYTPFVGVTSDENAPIPPPSVSPTLIPLSQITLTCPAASTTITMRNPEHGDKDISQFQRINRETRGGTLVVFSDPIWPRTQKLLLEFTGLTEEKGQEFLTFLNLSLGQYVELTDWDSNVWGGILTSPQSPIVRDGECKVFATVEFEGGRLSLQTITDTLSLTDQIIASDRTDTLWSGAEDDKLYLISGQFTSAIKFSKYVGGIDSVPSGIEWDGVNTPWSGTGEDKLYLQSGQFYTPVKFSLGVTGIDNDPEDISWDGVNTPWTGGQGVKLYLQSGQFYTPVKFSLGVSGIDTKPRGISWDGTDTPWCGFNDVKLYLQSGQFYSPIKDSKYVGDTELRPIGISWDGINTPFCGSTGQKLYIQSGQFNTVLKTSVDVSTFDIFPNGISSNNFNI